MDLSALREATIEATARALYDRHGFVPSEESDEWEAEYRKQFAALKQRQAAAPVAAPRPAATPPAAKAANGARNWPEITGTPEQKRWASAIRDERFAEIQDPAMRAFLAQNWTRAKPWIDTQDVPTATLLQRLKPQFEEYRRKTAEAARTRSAEAAQRQAQAAEHRRKLVEAGITAEGLVELVDASDRFPPAAIGAKLAEIEVEGRHLRLFETADPNLLLVKEKKGPLHEDYAIERDEGLVADLKLFAAAP